MAADLVRLENIRKTFGQGSSTVEVLHGIDLILQEGEFAALIGPSGSGKSTLLNIIGLLEQPASGAIRLANLDVGQLDEAGRSRLRGETIGFIFQFHYLISAFTAVENVMLPMLLDYGRLKPGLRQHALELLDAVGLGRFADRKPAALSGGQQQRVAVARALAMQPRLVLADEPTGNLDTHSADEVFALLRRFNCEQKITFLIVTHDPRLAQQCDRIIEMVDGRLVADHPGQ
jgi:lipoprotein-releasing system ATP-binding protein